MNGRLAPFVAVPQPSKGLVYPYLGHPVKAGHHLSQQGQGPTGSGKAELGRRLPQIVFHLLPLDPGASPSPCLDSESGCSLDQVVAHPAPYTSALYSQEPGYLVAWNTLPHVIHGQGLHPYMRYRTVPSRMVQLLQLLRRQCMLDSHATSIHQRQNNVTLFI